MSKKKQSGIFILIFLVFIYYISFQLNQLQIPILQEDYLYLAKNRQFVLGFEGEYATWLWIQSQMSLHHKVFSGAIFPKMFELYETITDMDPYFYDVYDKGSWYLTMVYDSPMPGIQLLEKGARQIPQAWIWLLLGQMYRLQRWELERKEILSQKQALERAFLAFQRAILLSPGTELAENLKSFLENPGGQLDTMTWVRLYCQSLENPLLATIFLKNLHKHILSIHLEYLAKHIKKYKEEFLRWPENLAVLGIPGILAPDETQASRIAIALYKLPKKYKEKEAFVRRYLLDCIANHASYPYIYDQNTGKIESSFLPKRKK